MASRCEGAFTACTFWLVDCLARQGKSDQARGIFDHVVSHANDLGLVSEEISTESGGKVALVTGASSGVGARHSSVRSRARTRE